MAYESINKKSSSWSATQQATAKSSPHQSYNYQPEQEIDALTQPEAYSREAYDIIASRIFRAPNPAIQTKTAPQLPASELEQDEKEQKLETAQKLPDQNSPEPPADNHPDSPEEDTTIQTKLTIGAPGDKYEQEADSMADKVMSMDIPKANTPSIQNKNQIHRKPISKSPSLVQRHFAAKLQAQRAIQKQSQKSTTQASPNLENQLAKSQGNGSPLDDQTRAFMEPRFGADLRSVRVHTEGAIQPKLAESETSPTEEISKETTQTTESESAQTIQTKEQPSDNNDLIQAKLNTNQAVKENRIPTTTLSSITPQLQPKVQPKKQNPPTQSQQKQYPPEKSQSVTHPSPTKTGTTSQPTTEGKSSSTVVTDSQPVTDNKPPLALTQNLAGEKSAEQTPTAGSTAKNSDVVTSNSSATLPPATATASQTTKASPEQTPAAGSTAKSSGAAIGGGAATLPSAAASQTTKASPEQDPEFQAVIETAKGVAAEQKKHDPAEAKAQAAQAAAEPPSNEVDSKAQAGQVGEMEQAETPSFDAAGFKAKLMQRIADMAPKNLEEADNFKNNNQLGSVKSELSGQVKEEQKASQGPLEEKTQEAPDKAGIEPKQVTPLPPNEEGEKTPQDIGADKAAPKTKSEAEVEAPIQQDSQKLDQQMAEANITEEQLENSNEPQFQTALGAKKEAQTNAATAPQEYRQQEQDILTNAKATAVSTAQQMLQGMQQVKTEQLTQVGTKQVESKGKDEQARTKIANDINQIYNNTKSKVEQTLSNLDNQVLQVFDSGAAEAKQVFEDYVSKRMEAYKQERYDGIIGKGKWVKDKLLGLPSEVNVFYQEGRQQYINKMDGAINSVVAIVSKGITAAKAEITKGKQEVQDYINKLPEELKSVGQEAAADIQSKFDQLEENVNSKQDELVDSLAQKYQENLQAVDSRIDEMKAANSGLMQKALDLGLGVIKTINQLKDLLLGALAGAAGAVVNILKNPIKFLGNLIQAVKQGFMNFVKNIGQYLQQGLIGWLTGTLGESGIQMPQSFDIKGIFSLVTQILGFTYDFIRGRAVQKIGAEKVGYLEKGEKTFQLLSTQGLVGVWDLIKEKVGDIKTIVIEGIKGFVITNIVQAGVQWVLSLLTPASAFVRACKMIIDIVRFFFERGAQIASLVGAITNSITAIASGSVGAAIKAVESALARSLPVVLGFLASLLGLGGIAGKIQAIIQKVRQPVTKAVDWVIDKGAKVANKFGDKFKKSKFGSKAIGYKEAAQQKYEAGKQWVEKKKQNAQQWFDKKKQSLMDATEKQKQRFLKTKAGKSLTAVNNALNNKLDALEKKKEAFNQKLETAKEWPNKQLEKVQDKAAEYRDKAKDKFKQSKVAQKLDQKWQDTKDWAGKKKESAQNWLNDKTEGAKDKLKDKLGFGKDKQKDKGNKHQPSKDQTKSIQDAQSDKKQKDNPSVEDKTPLEIPFSMKGEQHTLYLVSGATPSLDMASKRDRLSNKIGRAIAKLHQQSPKPNEQINTLKNIGAKAKTVQNLLYLRERTEAERLTMKREGKAIATTLSEYARQYGVSDIEEILDIYPPPKVGTHGSLVGEAPLPDGTTRESHHAPPVELAVSMANQLRAVAAKVKSLNPEAEKFLLDASSKLMAVEVGHGKNLPAILIHHITHKNAGTGGYAIHSKAIREPLERWLNDRGANTSNMVKMKDRTLASNPTGEEFDRFFNQQRHSKKYKAATLKSVDTKELIAETWRLVDQSYTQVSTQTLGAVELAVSTSKVDGKEAERKAAIRKLRSDAQQAPWRNLIRSLFPPVS
jgi:hypothetical protein